MLALRFAGPGEMAVVEHDDPTESPGNAVIDVIATGICGSDIHGYSGETGRRVAGQIMGHELVGRVRSSERFASGTLVTVNPVIGCGHCGQCVRGQVQVCPNAVVIGVDPRLDGSFASRLVAPEANVVSLPSATSPLHGALVEPLAVGYHAVMRSNPMPEDTMLVIGGGPIGQAVAIGARRAGVEGIVVSEPRADRRELVESLGFMTTDPADVARSIDEELGEASIVVDAVGVTGTVAAALENSSTRGRVVLVGMGSRDLALAAYEISVPERTLIGSYCYSTEHFEETAEWVGSGHPELDLLIDKSLPLADGPGIFHDLARGSGGGNKVMLMSS